jgi:hypothetical protein
MISTIAEIIRDLLIFVGVIAVMLIALVAVVTRLPETNPLKRVLSALCYRLGATLAAGVLPPDRIIPGLDLLYDVGYQLPHLFWYWYTFSETCVQSAPILHRQSNATSDVWRPVGHAYAPGALQH